MELSTPQTVVRQSLKPGQPSWRIAWLPVLALPLLLFLLVPLLALPLRVQPAALVANLAKAEVLQAIQLSMVTTAISRMKP